jgi:hypothetical protein
MTRLFAVWVTYLETRAFIRALLHKSKSETPKTP